MTTPARIASTCVMQTLRAAARAVTQAYEAALAPHGLTASQFSALVAAALGDGVTMGQLARRLGADRTTLTRVLAPLERRGLIASAAAKGDARSRVVTLSPEGRALLAAAIPDWEDAQARALARIGAGDWPAIQTRLARLRAEPDHDTG